jgi:Enoyl-CoA hydratase/isomerase
VSALELRWSQAGGAGIRVDLRLRPHQTDVWRHLHEIQRSLPGTVRVVVFRGLTDLPDSDDPSAYQQACDWTSRPAFLSVAVLDGHASGPALDLALGCDLRVISATAALSRPGPSCSGALVATVGYARAVDLAVTGRALSGSEAHALGLAQRLAAPDDLDAEVERLVADLLTPERDLVRELKALLLGASERGARAQREAQIEAVERLKSLRGRGAAQG